MENKRNEITEETSIGRRHGDGGGAMLWRLNTNNLHNENRRSPGT
jgi:hypothetical protein